MHVIHNSCYAVVIVDKVKKDDLVCPSIPTGSGDSRNEHVCEHIYDVLDSLCR